MAPSQITVLKQTDSDARASSANPPVLPEYRKPTVVVLGQASGLVMGASNGAARDMQGGYLFR